MHSQRFGREIVLTEHARKRMTERDISSDTLQELLETGEVRYKDETRLWVAKSFPDRRDNMLCVAAVAEKTLIVKTVMHHFAWEETP